MKLRSAPFQWYTQPLFEGEGSGSGSGAPPPPKPPELPPSKHDAPLPKGQETFDLAYVEELRGENKTWRGKMQAERTAREQVERERDEAKTAATKAKEDADKEAGTKITAAEAKANERVIRAELRVAAQKAGMVDLDGLKLADLSKVKLSEDGETVEGADALMTALKESKPYLFGAKPSGTSNPSPPPKPGDDAPKKAKDMTPEERASKLKELIKSGG